MYRNEKVRQLDFRAVSILLVLALASPFALLAQSAEEGWEKAGEGFYIRESEGYVEYLAQGSEGNANLLPIVEASRTLAEEAAAESPSEETLFQLDGWLAIEKEVAQKASSGIAFNALCTQYGASATTPALACGNQAQAFAWAFTGGNCQGPFNLYAFAQAVRTCNRTTQVNVQFDGINIVPPGGFFGVANASASVTGAYSTCGGDASAYAGSTADGVSHLVMNPGGSVSCSTNPFTCARCIRIIDDETR